MTPIDGGNIIAAGIPWFVAPFGRDSLIGAYEALMVNPGLARDVLLLLAGHQADRDDPLRDAEPGKILHEARVGELARAGHIPHTPYYGTVDATPLFAILAAEYFRWTGDLGTIRTLRPHLERALAWIAGPGDPDGDGFVEYQRRAPGGLDVHGWKDSSTSTMHADGTLVEGRVALAEVQGYVYAAKSGVADLFDALADVDGAARLRAEAARLKAHFNDVFWMPEEDTFGIALDGAKRLARSVASNAGHCLWTGIVDAEKAGPLAARLMAEDLFSGWGVRTLSAGSPAFNPMSYHNGSVWPHDNALIAAGLKRYGFAAEADRIARALIDAAFETRELRLPELFCGFRRMDGVSFVSYPVACTPQAWAAAAPFLLLQTMLGVSADARANVLTVNRPKLPGHIARADLSDVRVGTSRLSISFTGGGGGTAFSLLERDGDASVTMTE
jgi:glycogen debranching enzyme